MEQVQQYDKGSGIVDDDIMKRRSTYKESKSAIAENNERGRGSKFKLLAMKLSGSIRHRFI